jgi:hypothetical protein
MKMNERRCGMNEKQETSAVVYSHPGDSKAIEVLSQDQREFIGCIEIFGEINKLAKHLIGSSLVPKHIKNEADLTFIMMTGFELGLQPMYSLRQLHAIEGKVGMQSELMRAMVLSRCQGAKITCTVRTDERNEITVSRPGQEPESFTYTIQQAQKLKSYASSYAWKCQTALMLYNRNTGNACKSYFPDILKGVTYETGELLEQAQIDEAEIIDTTPRLVDALPKEKKEEAPLPKKKELSTQQKKLKKAICLYIERQLVGPAIDENAMKEKRKDPEFVKKVTSQIPGVLKTITAKFNPTSNESIPGENDITALSDSDVQEAMVALVDHEHGGENGKA